MIAFIGGVMVGMFSMVVFTFLFGGAEYDSDDNI
jgi:hypothetical protein